MLSPSTRAVTALTRRLSYNKIQYDNGNPYNIRWQWKIKNATYSDFKEPEATRVRKPEDTPQGQPPFFHFFRAFNFHIAPFLRIFNARLHRCADMFQLVVLPLVFFANLSLFNLSLANKFLTMLVLGTMTTRIQNKCLEPELDEVLLFDILYSNPEISPLFKPSSIHILDYEMEFTEGFPCQKDFPEFSKKLYRFFSVTSNMTEGFYKFADLDSGATMHLKFKTMPAYGKNAYELGNPYYIYDLRAQVTHLGKYKEIVLRDQKKELLAHRPFLIYL